MDNPIVLIVGAVIALGLIGYAFYSISSRKKKERDGQ